MINNLNSDQIEKTIINYFDYISQLQKKIRKINMKIKEEEQELSKNQKEEQEYLEMLVSDCTGKGSYRDSIMLPIDLKSQVLNCKDEKQKMIIQEKYNLAYEYAKKLETRYKILMNTEPQRLNKIKKSKKDIKKYKKGLGKLKKEYHYNMGKIKTLDKKLKTIKDDDNKQLTYTNVNKNE